MDDEGSGSQADAAQVAVARQHPFPAPGVAGAVPAAAVIAGFAQPAAEEGGLAAGAAERDLRVRIGGHGKGCLLAYDKKHYHRGFTPQMQALPRPDPGGCAGR